MRRCIIEASVASDRTTIGCRFVDDDIYATTLIGVVGTTGKGPVGSTTWNICEARTQIEGATGSCASRVHTGARASGSVCRCIIEASVASDRTAIRCRFVDDDIYATTLVGVVGTTGKGPVGSAAWNIRERSTQIE